MDIKTIILTLYLKVSLLAISRIMCPLVISGYIFLFTVKFTIYHCLSLSFYFLVQKIVLKL